MVPTLTPLAGGIAPVTKFAEFVLSLGVIRFALLGLLWLWLIWATLDRLRGGREDPRVRMDADSMTGSFSLLVSGSAAVLFVSLLIFLLWLPEVLVMAPVARLTIPVLVVLNAVHWWIERRERM